MWKALCPVKWPCHEVMNCVGRYWRPQFLNRWYDFGQFYIKICNRFDLSFLIDAKFEAYEADCWFIFDLKVKIAAKIRVNAKRDGSQANPLCLSVRAFLLGLKFCIVWCVFSFLFIMQKKLFENLKTSFKIIRDQTKKKQASTPIQRAIQFDVSSKTLMGSERESAGDSLCDGTRFNRVWFAEGGWQNETKAKLDRFRLPWTSLLTNCMWNKFRVILTFLFDYAVETAMHTIKAEYKSRWCGRCTWGEGKTKR